MSWLDAIVLPALRGIDDNWNIRKETDMTRLECQLKCADCGNTVTPMTAVVSSNWEGMRCGACAWAKEDAVRARSFQIGDVVRGKFSGVPCVLSNDRDLHAANMPGSPYELAYRASDDALAVLARPESVSFVDQIKKEDPGAWFGASFAAVAYRADFSQLRVNRGMWVTVTERAFPEALAAGLIHPESAKRWLEREQEKPKRVTSIVEQPRNSDLITWGDIDVTELTIGGHKAPPTSGMIRMNVVEQTEYTFCKDTFGDVSGGLVDATFINRDGFIWKRTLAGELLKVCAAGPDSPIPPEPAEYVMSSSYIECRPGHHGLCRRCHEVIRNRANSSWLCECGDLNSGGDETKRAQLREKFRQDWPLMWVDPGGGLMERWESMAAAMVETGGITGPQALASCKARVSREFDEARTAAKAEMLARQKQWEPDPYRQHRRDLFGDGPEERIDRAAAYLTDIRSVGAQRRAAFSADTLPKAKPSVRHPWDCNEDEP